MATDSSSASHGPFFGRLRERLASLSRDDLDGAILDYARRLDGPDRDAFLRALEPSASSKTTPAPAGEPSDPELLDEIDAFVADLKDHRYYQGWGWDPEIRDERAWGDESWVEVMDDLFERAEGALFEGDHELARDAYETLLGAFLLDQSDPVFCGPMPPREMVETDVSEAKARYLRAIYETEPADRRADVLVHAMRRLAWVGETVGVEAIADADAGPLPGFDRFVAAWTDALERATSGSMSWRDQRKWLLRDAAGLGGTEGLAELARRKGSSHPEAYREWVERLVEEGRIDDALDAAREAVETISGREARAALADLLGVLAVDRGQEETAIEAHRTAWRADPTPWRLRALCAALDEASLDSALEDELEALHAGEIEPGTSLACRLELLAGDYDTPRDRLESAKPLGWSGASHPGRVVFPFALAAACERIPPPHGTVLAGLWKGIDDSPCSPAARPQAEETAETLLAGIGGRDPDARLLPPPYGELVKDARERHPPTAGQRTRFLDVASEVARVRVHAIVSNQHRGAYDRAARVAVACAEAHHLAGDAERGLDLVREVREAFPRHSRFQREIRSALARSAVVGEASRG